MKKKYFLLLFIILFACTSSTPVEENTELFHIVLDPMIVDDEMIIPFQSTITLQSTSKEDLNAMKESFQNQMNQYHMLFDRYHSYDHLTNLKTINDSYESEKPIKVLPDLFKVIQEGIRLTKLSDGAFNITIGSLYDLWKDKFSSFPIENTDPDESSIKQALGCVVTPDQIDSVIELDEDTSSITLHTYEGCDDQVVIDLGAIAKGYASEACAKQLESFDAAFLLNAGSSSIITYVPEGKKRDWYIGVRNPYARVYTLYDYQLENCGVFTSSGDDSHYFMKKDGNQTIIRHHILNPKTGYPENHIRIATVSSNKNAMVADAITTSLFNIPSQEDKQQFIKRIKEEYDMDIEWAYFSETGEEKGILYTSNAFSSHIMQDSLSEELIEIEVLK